MIDLTAIEIQNLTAVELRKLGGQAGIKGASKGKKEFLMGTLMSIRHEQLREAEAVAAIQEATAEPVETTVIEAPKRNADGTLKGKCSEGCGRRITKTVIGPEMCDECLQYAEWENTHNDGSHEDPEGSHDTDLANSMDACPVCHPELDPRKVTKRQGRSRAGMVIIAKGTEIHKSQTFKTAAESAGWTVEMQREAYELAADAEGEGTRYYATATKGNDSISLAWDGRAYDYPASSAVLNGKARKVRNLKEALRVL